MLGLAPEIAVAGLDETRISAGLSKGLGGNIDLNVGVISTSYDIVGSLADRLEIYTGLSGSIACVDVSATAFFNTTDNWTGDTYKLPQATLLMLAIMLRLPSARPMVTGTKILLR